MKIENCELKINKILRREDKNPPNPLWKRGKEEE